MANFSFPIPDHVANIIFGEQKTVFTDSFTAFTQSGLVAEGTIQLNPSTKSGSVLRFSVQQQWSEGTKNTESTTEHSAHIYSVHSERKRDGPIEQERKDSFNKSTYPNDEIQNLRKHSAEMHPVHLEKKINGTRNVQNFVSSVWCSEKAETNWQMSEEEIYSNVLFGNSCSNGVENKYKYNSFDDTNFMECFRGNIDECTKQYGDHVDRNLFSKLRSKAEYGKSVLLKTSQVVNEDSNDDQNRDKTEILRNLGYNDLQEDSPKSLEMNRLNADISSKTYTEQNDLTSELTPIPRHKIEALDKSESCVLHPNESDKGSSQLPQNTYVDSTNKSETNLTSHDLLKEERKEESEMNWNLNEFMEPFNEMYPDLNTEESFYENILLHGECETTKEIFENVLMFADSNGFEMKDSSPTGNCMFQSINDQLQINGDFRFDVYTLRHLAVKYLESHPTDTEGTHLESFLDEPWNAYLVGIAQPYEWGDHLVLIALCEVLQRKIVVINVKTDDKTNHHEFEPKSLDQIRNEILYLGHLEECHYVSLRIKVWKQTWISAALRNRRHEKENVCFANGFESEIENRLLSNLSDTDSISGIPVPYISFAMTQIIESSELCYLKVPTKLIPREWCQISTAGGCSDGTEVFIIHKDKAVYHSEYFRRLYIEYPFMIFYDKNIVICDGGTAPLPAGQFRAVTCGIHPGYCSLIAYGENDILLTSRDVNISGTPDHTGRSVFGYQCLTWPVCAQEWLTRNSTWPSAELKEKIKKLGCFVAKRYHAHSRDPEVEWQFIFNEAEKLLAKEALSKRQLYVYGVFKSCVDHHSQHLKHRLGTVHIKSTFFFACEQIPEDTFEESPGVCLLYLTRILLKNVRERNLPNYFIKENNMIDHFRNDDIEKLIQILEAIRCFPLHCLVFMMDERGYNKSGIIDVTQKDSETYGREVDLNRAFLRVFFPWMIRHARKLAKCKKYKDAFAKIRDARLLLVLAPREKGGTYIFVPSLDNLLKQTLEIFDEDTVRFVTREMKACRINFITAKKVKDLTDGEDVGGFGEILLSSLIAGNPLEEARLLNQYGVILHNVDHNYQDAASYYSFALDKLKFAVVASHASPSEKNVSSSKFAFEETECFYLAFVCFKNLLLSGRLEKLEARMAFLEEVCIRGRFMKQVDFVMEAWERLGHPDRAAKFHSIFLEHLHSTK